MIVRSTLGVALIGLLLASSALAGSTGDAYPLSTCPVSGGKLGSMGDPVVHEHQGREVRFCCKGCLPAFRKDPAKFLKVVDAAIVKEQAARYPLTTCLVSGKALGDGAVDLVYRNRLVRLFDATCVAAFERDPAAAIAKLDAAVVEAQREGYPLDTCVVSGMKLDGMGGAIEYVHGNRLVRFCCKGCVRRFRKDPLTSLAKIDAAAAKSASKEESGVKDEGTSEKDGSCGGCGKDAGGGCGGGCGDEGEEVDDEKEASGGCGCGGGE